jgi:hypothetical protein
MQVIALALVSLTVLTVWLVAARPGMPRRIGRACLRALFEAGKWHIAPYLDQVEARCADPGGRAEPAIADDPGAVSTGTGEGAIVVRLLDGSLAKADYHAAMAELARLDADRHPLSLPGPDR